jgi:crotonobetainyl-CoA:carnitine CoA-transferase CaiB-like acyl-CoA transferase
MKLLSGIRIVEQGTFITGPCCGMLLADLGADVIKVEAPGEGDPYRNFKGGLYSPHFQAYNRNKRSICLDIRKEDDRSIFDSLIKGADVYIQNFRPGAAERMGSGEARLKSINPGLIYCSISGFGEDGPYAHRPSYDTVSQALSGFLGVATDPERPRILGPAIADSITGIYAAVGIAAALVRKKMTGEGLTLGISMLEAMMHYAIEPFTAYFALGEDPTSEDRPRLAQAFVLTCADGKLVALHLSSLDKFWSELMAAVDASEISNDPRFARRLNRIENYKLLTEALDQVFRSKPRSYWLERLDQRDVPFSPVNFISETTSDPQVEHLGMIVPARGGEHGAASALRPPFRMNGERDIAIQAAPILNQDSANIRSALAHGLDVWRC